VGASIDHVVIRDARLRWPIADDLAASLIGQRISGVERRAKYLIISCDNGFVLAHLGMTGSLRITSAEEQVKTHDHWDFLLSGGAVLRYHDPRRFGSLHYIAGPQLQHPLLTSLGPEPLSEAFTGVYLYQLSRRRKQAVKLFLMDAKIVVGVGNIYANEALFAAGIDPRRAAGRVSLRRYELLAAHVKRILASAIERGGTTLRDFVGGDGKPGYFAQELSVYGRANQPCIGCHALLKEVRLGQRTTVYCSTCQN
jgi:formamidopyrimidine-DNA glycosylase